MTRRQLDTKYLFIDGAYFQNGLRFFSKEFYGGSAIELDYNRVRADFDKVFYYDSIYENQRSDESPEQQKARIQSEINFLNKIRATENFHVYEGVKVSEKKQREQKQVDILISVHMMKHAFYRTMQRACLLSGDLDFKPLVDALVELGIHVTLWYFPDNTSDHLKFAADSRFRLDIDTVHNWTTQKFQKAHPIPTGSGQFERDTQGFALLRTQKTASGRDLEIYSSPTGFLALNRNDEDSHWFHWKGANEDLLLKYLRQKAVID